MDTFLAVLLALALVFWEGLSAAFGWVVDHFFEIAVLYALFIYLPRCMALMRVDSGDTDDLYDKIDEIVRLLDELNDKAPDPYDINDDRPPLPPPMYDDESEPEPTKPTKPYPY